MPPPLNCHSPHPCNCHLKGWQWRGGVARGKILLREYTSRKSAKKNLRNYITREYVGNAGERGDSPPPHPLGREYVTMATASWISELILPFCIWAEVFHNPGIINAIYFLSQTRQTPTSQTRKLGFCDRIGCRHPSTSGDNYKKFFPYF